jgi:hypothetical protein
MFAQLKNLSQKHKQLFYIQPTHNRNFMRIPHLFNVGNLVFCRNHPLSDASRNVSAKLSSRWRGPLRVDCFLTLVTVKLVEPTNFVRRGHLSQMKPASGV